MAMRLSDSGEGFQDFEQALFDADTGLYAIDEEAAVVRDRDGSWAARRNFFLWHQRASFVSESRIAGAMGRAARSGGIQACFAAAEKSVCGDQ